MSKRHSRRATDWAGLARMLKALSHPNRLRLFEEIRRAGETSLPDQHGCFLNHIISRLDIGAPTVSHHLKELVDAGLVTTAKQGKFLLCRVDARSLERLERFFSTSP